MNGLQNIKAGRLHLSQGKYEDAERELTAAVIEAEKGGVEDRRLAATLVQPWARLCTAKEICGSRVDVQAFFIHLREE